MKRFFKPLEKEKEEEEKDGPEQKKPALSSPPANKTEPLKFVTWNAYKAPLLQVLTDLDSVLIAKQEVRMPAAGAKSAPKNPGELKDDTTFSCEEKRMLLRALLSPPFGEYRVWWSLGDSRYAGTALLLKKCLQPKVFFSLDRKALKHEADGHVILAVFETCCVLNTYSPNNGWKGEENAFQRRQKWDKRLLDFVSQSSDKSLIWCGDLNVRLSESSLNSVVSDAV